MTIRRLLAPILLLSLAACAADEPRHRGAPGGRPESEAEARGGPPPVRLFISPSGEPFRGDGGLARWFAQVDTDHDGSITLEEFRVDARHSFQFLDTNHDGTIDGFEMQAYEHDIVPEIGVMTFDQPDAPRRQRRAIGGPSTPGGGVAHGGVEQGSRTDPAQMLADQATAVPKAAGRDGAARFSLLNEPEPIAAADADVDGKVTLGEWMARTDARFAKLDWQKTGKLTIDSLLRLQPRDQKGGPKRSGPPPR